MGVGEISGTNETYIICKVENYTLFPYFEYRHLRSKTTYALQKEYGKVVLTKGVRV